MQADTACWLMTNEYSEDECSVGECSEDECSEDESSEDESSEDESSEDESSEDENSEDENSEDESSEDENSEDEDLISEMSQRREDYNSLHLKETVSTNEDQIAVELVFMGSTFADHLTADDEDSTENSTATVSDEEMTEDSTVASFSDGESQGVETTRSSSSEFSAIEDDLEYVTFIDELYEEGDWLDDDRHDEESRKGYYRYHREFPEDDAPFEEEMSVELVLRSRNLSFANYFFSPSRDVHDVTEVREALGQPLPQQGQVEGKAVRFKAVVSENAPVTNEDDENLVLPLPEEGNNIVFEEQQVKRPKAEKIVNPEEEKFVGKKDERILTKLNPKKSRIMSLFKRKSTRAERDGASTAVGCHGLRSFRTTRASE